MQIVGSFWPSVDWRDRHEDAAGLIHAVLLAKRVPPFLVLYQSQDQVTTAAVAPAPKLSAVGSRLSALAIAARKTDSIAA